MGQSVYYEVRDPHPVNVIECIRRYQR